MSAVANDSARSPWNASPGAVVRWIGSSVASIVTSPFRAIQSVRRSMTAASATLVVFTIVSLNIIWGYPWIGVFAACISILAVGLLINRVMAPRLEASVSLPRSAAVGSPFQVRQHIVNTRRVPVLDLRLRFASENCDQVPVRSGHATRVSRLGPRERISDSTFVCFNRRGIHRLPELEAQSTFPFYLFRVVRRIPLSSSIAVTPRLISEDDEPLVKRSLNAASGWAKRLLSGASMEYVGNREYQIGMTVRRWDFASWARLGRPIVREFNTPSARSLTIIVDTGTSAANSRRRRADQAESFERLLSLTATIVTELSKQSVQVRLFLTRSGQPTSSPISPTTAKASPNGISGEISNDQEGNLILLAGARPIPAEQADRQISEFLAQHRTLEPLILSTRPGGGESGVAHDRATYVRVDPQHASPSATRHSRRTLDGGSQQAASVAQQEVS